MIDNLSLGCRSCLSSAIFRLLALVARARTCSRGVSAHSLLYPSLQKGDIIKEPPRGPGRTHQHQASCPCILPWDLQTKCQNALPACKRACLRDKVSAFHETPPAMLESTASEKQVLSTRLRSRTFHSVIIDCLPSLYPKVDAAPPLL